MTETTQLSEIVKLRKGKKAVEVHGEQINGAKPYIQIDEVRGTKPRKFASDPRGVDVTPDDLCIVWDGANAGTIGYGIDGFIGSTVTRMRLTTPDEWDTRFIGRLLQSSFRQLNDQAQARGATIPHVDKSKLEAISLPCIPIAEQQRIAAILDKADGIRHKCEKALEMADDFLRSVFLEMFGEAGTSDDYEPLGPHLRFVTSGSRGWAKYYSMTGARFIRSLDVQMNMISDEDVVYVNPPKSAESERTKVQTGDVLLTITGSKIGRVAEFVELPQCAYISQHVAILRPKRSILPGYLSYYLSLPSLGQRQIDRMQYGQAKPGLNLKQIRSFRLPVPLLDRQQVFIDIVAKVRGQKNADLQQLRFCDELIGSLNQRAFCGSL